MNGPTRCVFIASGEVQAQQVASFLQAWGIQATLQGEALRKVHGVTVGRLGAVAIHVTASDEALARRLLESVEGGEFSLKEDESLE
jgi:hypothetical protein